MPIVNFHQIPDSFERIIHLTPAPSLLPQLSSDLNGQSWMRSSSPLHLTSSMAKSSGTDPNMDFSVAIPCVYPNCRHTTPASLSSQESSQTGPVLLFMELMTKMFPSLGVEPPISVTKIKYVYQNLHTERRKRYFIPQGIFRYLMTSSFKKCRFYKIFKSFLHSTIKNEMIFYIYKSLQNYTSTTLNGKIYN